MSAVVSFAHAHPRLATVGLASASGLVLIRAISEIVRALT